MSLIIIYGFYRVLYSIIQNGINTISNTTKYLSVTGAPYREINSKVATALNTQSRR